ncbi:MAG: uracil phosphoribosyltransferase [Synergistes jonesii]|uniref:uracil phosphoribosyltransferase n=1 Tax=Synergistes jonesii TaxID=2754 RepID=UPI00248E7448|nr:uracil phosphoribosyltransferase [Synergistes jonesii]MDY2985035.1 uracil phosphoribosyltransferase [Synergistes jonesii]
MKIAVASDHAGYKLKEEIKRHLAEKNYDVLDFGSASAELKVDYPDWGFKAAGAVASHKAERGILVCGTGIGMSIVANKVRGIRAALCHDHFTAVMSRRHNDANVLVLGARVLGTDVARDMVDAWLDEPFEGGRHSFRLDKISAYEEENCKKLEASSGGGRTVVIDHPLVRHKLGLLRNKETSSKDFRDLVQEVAGLMVYEVTRHLPLEETEIETPIEKTRVFTLSGKKLAVVPVLRAGLGMVEGILKLVPNAKVGHIGLYRDPKTLKPVDYYCKLPCDISEREIFVVDPMLATGGSAVAAVGHIIERGGKKISLVSLIAAPEGIATFHEAHPDVDIFVAAVDSHLNEHCYIVPGLGDAGDRLFGTK